MNAHPERIAFDFGPHTESIAEAGYLAYHGGLLTRPWSDLRGHETHRWMMAAEDVFSKPRTSPQRIREVYLTGILHTEWDWLKGSYQKRWALVWQAMMAARTEWVTMNSPRKPPAHTIKMERP